MEPSDQGPSLIGEAVAESLAGEIGGPLILVLDDYDLISSSEVREAFGYLVENLPDSVHLAIVSVADPEFRLTQLRARGKVTEVRAGDLRLGMGESGAFLGEIMGLELDPPSARDLARGSEGWLAALQLAAVSVAGHTDVPALAMGLRGSRQNIAGYLTSELLRVQDEDVRRFLLHTSIFDRFTADTCDTVMERSDSREMIERLESANLPLMALDDGRRWFGYHRLFAEALKAQFADEAGPTPDLHHRACTWFENQDLDDEAIDHAALAGDVGQLMRLVLKFGPARFGRGELATVERWLAMVPADRPQLRSFRAWIALVRGDPSKAEHHLAGSGPHPQAPRAIAVLAGAAVARRDDHAAIDHARTLLEDHPGVASDVRGAAAASLARAAWRTGDQVRAVAALRAAIQAGHEIGDLGGMVTAARQLARIEAAQGDLEAIETICSDGAELLDRAGLSASALALPWRLTAAELAYQRNDLTIAEGELLQGIEFGGFGSDVRSLTAAYVTLARVQEAQGDGATADLSFERGRRVAGAASLGDLVEYVNAHSALRDARRMNLAPARAWAAGNESADVDPFDDLAILKATTRIRVALADRRPRHASEIIGAWSARVEDAGLHGLVLEMTVLEAVAQFVGGEATPALERLGSLLPRAEQNRYVRLFVDEGAAIRKLLLSLLETVERPAGRRYLEALASACRRSGLTTARAAPAKGAGNFTLGDIELLRLIVSGASIRQAAAELSIAPDVVRNRVAGILEKLDATSRGHAVARARSRGVL